MGQNQSDQSDQSDYRSVEKSNERRKTMPELQSCNNNMTCKNFDFQKKGFACPNAKCTKNGCSCGSECKPFKGTCCKDVVYDENRREYICVELSGGPRNRNNDLNNDVLEYDPNDIDIIYHPVEEKKKNIQVNANDCGFKDRMHNGILIKGDVLCRWSKE